MFEVAFHFVAIMSNYHRGARIGWHYSAPDKLDKELINTFFAKVKKKCGDVHFGIHKLSTDSLLWDSVTEKDDFFSDVIATKEMDTFIEYVSSDQKLSAHDVAKFLLTIIPSSHLKLQKLLYYCYAAFLERTGERLFEDPIVAYKYGPVIESVFQDFKIHGSSVIDYQEDEEFVLSTEKNAVTPSFIKIVNSEHGVVVIDCILDVLNTYGELNPFELVEKTHQEGGPWHRVYKPGENCVLTDDLITQYHQYAK